MAKKQFVTKDSGKRQDYKSGMRRDTQEGKPDFSLLLAGLPYEDEMITRWAGLMTRGAEKYGRRNWQLAESAEELERFRASAFRHFIQWMTGNEDEDHASAVFFNINASEYVKHKLDQKKPDQMRVINSAIDLGIEIEKCKPSVGKPGR